MNIEEKYEEVTTHVADLLNTSETFLVFANYLLVILNEKSKDSRYDVDDLMNYPYVLEYLRHNPRDELLVLAHTIHSLLFLYETFKED